MNRELRLALFETELGRLLQSDIENDHLTFADLRDANRYVHYMRHDRALYAEVGSPARPMADHRFGQQSERALGCLGFAAGGRRRSYSRDHLPRDARRLACLTELLFGAAYGETEDLTVIVMTRSSREAEQRPPRMELGG